MKNLTNILKLAALIIAACTIANFAIAQTTNPPTQAFPCPVMSGTNTNIVPGPAWTLTPEQLNARWQAVQQWVSSLRAKRDNGTITPQEKQWLEAMEQRGGLCINGIPRGPQGRSGMMGPGGAGYGFRGGRGQGFGQGPGAMAGPRMGYYGYNSQNNQTLPPWCPYSGQK